MKATLILSTLVLMSCGTLELDSYTYPPKQFIDEEFMPYVERFTYEANKRSVGVERKLSRTSIVFHDAQDHSFQAARCKLKQKYTYSRKYATIQVIRRVWLAANDYQREYLVTHELGHCILYLGHSESRSSFMYDWAPSTKQSFDLDFDSMYDELFAQ